MLEAVLAAAYGLAGLALGRVSYDCMSKKDPYATGAAVFVGMTWPLVIIIVGSISIAQALKPRP